MATASPAASGSTTSALIRLTLSAFVVLAAEPSFVLVDTAVVGHLGSTPLAALGIGGTLVSLVALLGVFLDYGTTGRAARWYGAADRGRAVDEGVNATLIGLAIGVVVAGIGELVAGPLVRLLAGGSGPTATAAESWFRIAVLGVPGMLVILAGHGWMRGVQEVRKPVWIVVAANVLSAAASPILVYPVGLGLEGSAIANLGAQLVAGALFLRALQSERRPWQVQWDIVRAQLRVGFDLLVRAAGFQIALMTAAAVAARMGTTILAAHQIGLECWEFVALLLDSFAIAAQSLVGAALGGSDGEQARHLAWRVARYGLWAGIGFAVVLAAGWTVIPLAFTSSPAVLHQAHVLWPFFFGMQPAAGVVFALDGVLIGAGDVAFMRTITLVAMVGCYAPIAVAALHWHWGIAGIWAGLTAAILVRLVGMLLRTARGRWVVVGAR